ncbi:hypothetical protein Q5O14_00930 [Eubacteriaceae bacterium ES2]|nr:hypothetical protein Q5O14_00930 [Eubacteriaceae bacterium ES2]
MKNKKMMEEVKMTKEFGLKRNKVLMAGSAAILTAALVAIPGLNSIAKADTEYTLYVAVDQSVLGGSALIEPVAYTTDDTSKTVGQILDAVKGDATLNIVDSTYGDYLAGVGVATDPTSVTYDLSTYPMTSTLTTGATDAHMINTNCNDQMLSEKEFTSQSGWMFAIDSQTHNADYSVYYSMDTTIADLLSNGVLDATNTDATIRCYYSLNMGADLGMANSSYLPTNAATYNSTYNTWAFDWNTTTSVANTFDMANKDELVAVMAEDPTNAAYDDALTVLNDVDATNAEVALAISDMTE